MPFYESSMKYGRIHASSGSENTKRQNWNFLKFSETSLTKFFWTFKFDLLYISTTCSMNPYNTHLKVLMYGFILYGLP